MRWNGACATVQDELQQMEKSSGNHNRNTKARMFTAETDLKNKRMQNILKVLKRHLIERQLPKKFKGLTYLIM